VYSACFRRAFFALSTIDFSLLIDDLTLMNG